MKKTILLCLACLFCFVCLSCFKEGKIGEFKIIQGPGEGTPFSMRYELEAGLRVGDTVLVTKYGYGWSITNSGSVPDRKVVFLGPK